MSYQNTVLDSLIVQRNYRPFGRKREPAGLKALHFCAKAIFKVVLKNNPPALENLLLKIILVVRILANPKLPMLACLWNLQLANIFKLCRVFLYTLYNIALNLTKTLRTRLNN